MMTAGMLCALLLAGCALLRQAAAFIAEAEGVTPLSLAGSRRLLLLFMLQCAAVLVCGRMQELSSTLLLRNLLLAGWSLLLTQLDLARCWLPQRFTCSLIVSGLLYTLLPQSGLTFSQAAREGLMMYTGLLLFRWWVSRDGTERFGMGDVYLLTGLTVWLTLPLTVLLVLAALCLILLLQGGMAVTRRPPLRELPFAPWLCGCLNLMILLPDFTLLQV